MKEKIECPRCKSKNVIPILYGYPMLSAMRKAEKGLIELGGCCIGENDPNWHCKDCKNKFIKKEGARC